MKKDYSLLNDRKRSILKAVVIDYVKTAEPVGSRNLVEVYGFDVKSATIRNEMAELSELGYLRQPHTSAGRIPSDLGYRFYVDWLINYKSLAVHQSKKNYKLAEQSQIRSRSNHTANL